MKPRIWLICFFSMAISTSLFAEVLEMPEPEVISPDEATSEEAPAASPDIIDQPISITLPGRGMLKDQVEERFGSPSDKVPPVGEPPISSWVYNGFTVYFEYEHVIHAVKHK